MYKLIRIFISVLLAGMVWSGVSLPAASSASLTSLVWVDETGDLWVRTRKFQWNITSGKQIDLIPGPQSWHSAKGSRLVDDLFLTPQPGGQLTYRIISQLADMVTIALERHISASSEVLVLTFSSLGDIVTLVHYSLDNSLDQMPGSLSVPFHFLPVSEVEQYTGEIPAQVGALRLESIAYSSLFSPAYRQGIARLHRMDELVPAQLSSMDSCLSLYEEQTCSLINKYPQGQYLGSEYLIIFQGNPFDPVNIIEEWSARLQLAFPDLDAASISRTPRYDYDSQKNNPAQGDNVVFTARIANRGGLPTGQFSYQWQIDGEIVASSDMPSLQPGEMITVELPWSWQAGPHRIAIYLDPTDAVDEVSESNNTIEDYTTAIAIGFWVEQSVYDYFNLHQIDLGIGSNSWDDWAQRLKVIWNQIFAESINPLTPTGVTERVRIDKIMIVPDGSLPNPYPSNFPDINDKKVDLMWGFVSEGVGVPSNHPQYGPYYLDYPQAQDVDYSLIHELSHARYLDDLYTLNVTADHTTLSSTIGPGETSFTVNGEVGGGPFTPPAYLAMDGELVVCSSASGNLFSGCVRGAEGTTPRPHFSGGNVNRASVRVQDGLGNLVMGNDKMPLIGFNDHLYYNRYSDDMMNGGQIYREHSAYALNLIAGQRPVCGNYNAPCNLGIYENDAPEHNILIIAQGKQPIAGVKVDVFQARPFYYSYNAEVYLKDPDVTYYTDPSGQIDLGHFPFDPKSQQANSYNRVILLRLTFPDRVEYRFLEITYFNEAYWAGDQIQAYYYLDSTTDQVDVWIRPGSVVNFGETPVNVPVRWGNNGELTADAPYLSATFDSSLIVLATDPPAATILPGEVNWLLPAVSSRQIGKVSLTFGFPDSELGSKYLIHWQINHALEADPSDNYATSTIFILKKSLYYLPFIQKFLETAP